MYGVAVAARNRLYDRGTLTSRKLSRPIISVGSISAGGAGKTPFVILLGDLLRKRDITFDVLSRGYGRETRGVLEVDPNGSPRDFADEPLLIAKKLGCPVVVGESRHKAGLFAEKNSNAAFHLLDDGFQHRSLARDFDIVLLTPEDVRDDLLPAGRLREPLSSLSRADAIVLTGEVDVPKLPADKLVWRLKRSLKVPVVHSRPIVFCGIARPQQFVDQLREAGIEPVAHKFFRDHHRYTAADIRDLLALQKQNKAESFITTQKDVMNLGQQFHQLAPISVASVEMELLNAADALDTMLRVIADRRAKP
jgi:tetraacyldisaccharide 4'-kinase